MFGTLMLRPDEMITSSKSTFSFSKSEEQSFQKHHTLKEIIYFSHLTKTENTGLKPENVQKSN